MIKKICRKDYTSDYFECHARLALDENSYQSKRVRDIFEHLKPEIKEKILEAGCGAGSVLLELGKYGYSACGIDFSEDAVKITKRTVKEYRQIDAMCGDVTSLPFRDSIFREVIQSDVVEHLYNHKESYKELYRVLEDNGTFIISTAPNKWNVFYIALKFLHRLKLRSFVPDPLHVNEQSPYQIINDLRKEHFKIEYYQMDEPYKPLSFILTNSKIKRIMHIFRIDWMLFSRITVRAIKCQRR